MTALPLRLRAMLIHEKYTDCSFLLENDTCVHGHKIILAASSPVFEAMFYGPLSNQNESRPIPIVDASAKIFRAMLNYVYTDELEWSELSNSDLLELFYCVEKYLIGREDILNRIRSSLNCNSLFLFYDFAIRFKLPLLLTDCRQLLSDLLDKKPNLFFKKVLQVNCDREIQSYEEDEGHFSAGEEAGPAKRKPPLPIEYIEDIVFGAPDPEPIGQYHQVGRECLNDMLVLNCDADNGLFNENLLLFVLKWTKIEWKLQSKGLEKLPLQKIPLLNFYNSFVCRRRTDALVENLVTFLENHFYLNKVSSISGWHLMQRVDLKASRPLTISPTAATSSFDTVFQVNHLITIKSLIINSRLNNAILSRLMRSTATPQQFVYKENLVLEIFSSDTEGRGLISTHRQQFSTETEFNAQCELFLNKCLFFHPHHIYTLRFHWPKDLRLSVEYPRQFFEPCQRLLMTDKQLSIVFVDDAATARNSSADSREGVDLISGGILCGLQFMFVS